MKTDPTVGPRLRAPTPTPPFSVVLVEPEIPPNTGNIARLCAATGSALHLVGPLGFSIDEHAVRRAGVDYWHLVDVHEHADLATAEASIRGAVPDSRSWVFSGKAGRSFLEADFRLGDALVFGCESAGLPEELVEERGEQAVAIPTLGAVRSLNLANAVAIVVYEALRKNGALDSTELR